jgi:predicted aspartyl protease
MTSRPNLSVLISTMAVPLLAASLLAACDGVNQTQMAVVQAPSASAGDMLASASPSLPSQMAAQCSLAPVGEVQMRMTREQAFVPLKVNNSTLNLLLDTGDFVTSLTPQAVSRLALPNSGQPGLQMTGIGGSYQAPIVQAADVQYLDHHLQNLPFAVLPDSEFRPEEHTDGLFGANFLSAYEVELDFPAGRMRFYQSSPGCSTGGPSWMGSATRLQATDAGHQLLMIPVRVNGVELNALIDTGSEDTSITQDAADLLGVTKASMRGDQQITEQGLGESSERLHRFASISIGGATFRNPVLAVDDAPSPLQSAVVAEAMSALPPGHRSIDVILGANYLFKTRVFLAYKHNAVYIQ